MTNYSQSHAANELLRRRKARGSFSAFLDYLALDQAPARHHQLLNDTLQKVADGEIKRLMVFMPPGSAKSTYGSTLFPAWYLGNKEKDDDYKAYLKLMRPSESSFFLIISD